MTSSFLGWGNSWRDSWGIVTPITPPTPVKSGLAIIDSPYKKITIPSSRPDDYQGYVQLNNATVSLSYDHSEFGEPSAKGTITGASGTNDDDLPHRGYGYIHLDQYPVGVFRTPCKISFRVWVDISLQVRPGLDDWFSFATFGFDSNWDGLFTVNLNPQGFVYLQHTPVYGEQTYKYQASAENAGLSFPMRQWVDLEIIFDGNPANGYAKVFQDSVLVSYADISSGNGKLARAHFGMYASPAVSSGVVYNKNIVIEEIVFGGHTTKEKKNKPRKKKEKLKDTLKIPDIISQSREITEDEAKGMAAIYGAQMRASDPVVEPIIDDIETVFEPIDIQGWAFKEKDPSTQKTRSTSSNKSVDTVDNMLIEDQEQNEIALILAIIEAIG